MVRNELLPACQLLLSDDKANLRIPLFKAVVKAAELTVFCKKIGEVYT